MNKYTTKKYMGDDIYSWALFKNGQPIMTGMSRSEARYEKEYQIKRDKEKENLAPAVRDRIN